MTNKVFVVYGTDLGWDCLVAAYNADSPDISLERLQKAYPKSDNYVIREMLVERNVYDRLEELRWEEYADDLHT